jgi:hypothetical protein
MRFTRAGLRPAIGTFVIAHGLAHAVLPLRGGMDPATLPKDFVPLILYVVAVLGFTIGGLGIIGWRPFAAAARPSLVLASTYSLVLMSRMGQGDLWWGVALDIVLLLAGLTGVYRHLPQPPRSRHEYAHRLRVAAAGAIIVYGLGAVVLWPLYRAWGSLPAEHGLVLPGDPDRRQASLELQHAVTVNAPPEAVWAWLVQLGQDRAGFYSYDWLERAFGVNIRNTYEIRPEWQARQAGDRVRATQENYLRGAFGREPGWTVTEVVPNRAMVLQYWGAFVLEPTADGKTRFIIRTKVADPGVPVWAAPLDMVAFQLPHFIMERRMMLRIKSLAESQARVATS